LDWRANRKDQAQKGKVKKEGAILSLYFGKFGDLVAVQGSKQGRPGSIEAGAKIQFFSSQYTRFTSFTSITVASSIRDRIGMAWQLGYPFQDKIQNTRSEEKGHGQRHKFSYEGSDRSIV
jgi:hypothetical protein